MLLSLSDTLVSRVLDYCDEPGLDAALGSCRRLKGLVEVARLRRYDDQLPSIERLHRQGLATPHFGAIIALLRPAAAHADDSCYTRSAFYRQAALMQAATPASQAYSSDAGTMMWHSFAEAPPGGGHASSLVFARREVCLGSARKLDTGFFLGDKLHGYGCSRVRRPADGTQTALDTWSEGEFLDGRLQGRGTVVVGSHLRVSGTFFENHLFGHATLRWVDKFFYRGEVDDLWPHGRGVMQYAGDASYRGNFRDGMPHGRGRYTFSNGDAYVGDIEHGREHGRGAYHTAEGAHLEGTFTLGEVDGPGRLTLAAGKVLIGTFRPDKDVARGRLLGPNGATVEAGSFDVAHFLRARRKMPHASLVRWRRTVGSPVGPAGLRRDDGDAWPRQPERAGPRAETAAAGHE